jgi:hypothetical protein
MAKNVEERDGWRGSPWRKAAWLGAAGVLLLPLVAMQFTDEVNWSLSDFVFAAIFLFGFLGAYELVARMTGDTVYRAGAGVAIAALFLLTWSNAAVGITDSEADFYIFFGVPAVAIGGAIIARFRPRGMAIAMVTAALAQSLIAAIALAVGIIPAFNSAFEIVGITGFFVALFLGSALLFRRAARATSVEI